MQRAGTCPTLGVVLAVTAGILAMPALAQVPPVGVADQLPLLKSADPKLAANKRLVFDMYRTVLNAGRAGEAPRFFTPGYIQHNPNVTSGRDGLVAYIRRTRPERAIPAQIAFPVISITAEGDRVIVATVSYEDDLEKPGEKYVTTHFDMFRIENGLIAEHWDNVGRSAADASKDPNLSNRPR
jgi:predicted SnoaL-like aldol condensation-catalyzing enzyme